MIYRFNYRYFCTDCNEYRSCLRDFGRCTMCGGGRIIDVHAIQDNEPRCNCGHLFELCPQADCTHIDPPDEVEG